MEVFQEGFMKIFAACCLPFLLALPAAGLEPYLVKDINPVPASDGSDPSELVTVGGAALFFADDGVSGRGLWRSDGTPEGTWHVSEVPGYPRTFLTTERLYFFLAPEDSASDPSLWVSDGTTAGTLRLTGPGVGVGIIDPRKLWVESHGALYFVAWDQEHGAELWRTDGTPVGTWLLADLRPGPEGSAIGGMVEHKGRLWFGADDGQRGGALWRTDGTPAGTVLALDPLPAAASGAPPQELRVLGSRLTFFAPTPARGEQLWAGDGTARGTAPVTTLSRGSSPSLLLDGFVRGNRLYFVAQDKNGQELWVSDGTGRGTRVLTGFPNPAAFFPTPFPGVLYAHRIPRQQPLANRLVFPAFDGPHGSELWITDGTRKGTRLLREVCPGACAGVISVWPVYRGRLYFVGSDSQGSAVWATDGTAAGTRKAADPCPEGCFLHHAWTFHLGTRLVFATQQGPGPRAVWSTDGTAAGTVRLTGPEQAYAGPGAVLNGSLLFGLSEERDGTELWRTDGTAAGTRQVADINSADLGGSYPQGLRALGGEAVFGVYAPDPELWKSDGTEPGTGRIRTLPSEEADNTLLVGTSGVAAGRLFFFLHKDRNPVLWRTDGTEEGTFPLAEALPRCCELEVRAVGDTAFFTGEDEDGGRELWASDGTVEGTRRVRDIEPGHAGSGPDELTAFQGKLFFTAETSENGRELWRSDGTEAGTVQVVSTSPVLLTVHAGRLWFFAADDEHGWELWSSDGTEAGTGLAVEFEPGPGSFDARALVSLGSRLFVSSGEHGFWVTDGTPAGTRKIHDEELDDGAGWAVFQGRLYYVLQGGAVPEPLRVTDGTEAGTGLLLDRDGKEIHFPGRFVVLDDRFFFTVGDFGLPLWESDGTPEGTFQIHERTDGELIAAGSRVFFRAYDRIHGWELWAAGGED